MLNWLIELFVICYWGGFVVRQLVKLIFYLSVELPDRRRRAALEQGHS